MREERKEGKGERRKGKEEKRQKIQRRKERKKTRRKLEFHVGEGKYKQFKSIANYIGWF